MPSKYGPGGPPSPGVGKRPDEGTRGLKPPPAKPAAAKSTPIRKPDEGTRPLVAKPPPNSSLQSVGYHGSIHEFNERVQAATDAHERWGGYRPSAGLVFDIARSPVKTEEIPLLFEGLPRTMKAARAASFAKPDAVGRFQRTDPFHQKIAQSAEFGILNDVYTDDELLDDMDAALKKSRKEFVSFYTANKDRIERIMETPGRGRERAITTTQIQAQGITGDELAGRVLRYAMKAELSFAIGMASGPPILAYEEGKGIVESVNQRSLRPLGATQVKLGKDIVRSAVVIAKDPLAPENVAFAAQMFLGGAAIAGGGVARAAAAGRQIRSGQGVTAAIAAPTSKGGSLLRRPPAGRTTVKYGELEVQLLNSENAAVRPVQLAVRRTREKLAQGRHRRGYQPVPAESISIYRKFPGARLASKTFSWERKMGRELDKRARMERELRLITHNELIKITGWSQKVTRAVEKLPAKVRNGLTRGEEMAIVARTLDDDNPIATMRAFHEDKIAQGPAPWKELYGEIDPAKWEATHREKVALLALAEKVLANPEKQSPRFKEALRLVDEGVAEMEAIKLSETHLTQLTADTRVAKAGEVFRSGEPFVNKGVLATDIERLERRLENGRANTEDQALLVDLKGQLASAVEREAAMPARSPDATYMPLVSNAKRKLLPKDMMRGGRLNWLRGIGRQELRRNFPEVYHEFTGKAIVAGDYRVDATRLVGEAVGRAVQGAFRLSQYADLLRTATPRPKSIYDRPILKPDADGWPDELKAILLKPDEPELTARDAEILSKQDWHALETAMFPARRNPETGMWEPTVPVDGVLWVDERLLSPAAFRPPVASVPKGLERAQDVYRVPALYLKPSYALNMLSNEVMALIYQGPLAPWRFAKALFGKQLMGAETYRAFAEMVGVGRFRSYADQATASKLSRGAAHFWNRFTDQDARISTAMFYAEKMGYKTEDLAALVKEARADRKSNAFEDLLEIKERTNKGMVQLDNMTWVESAYLRHALFVYPWRRGQAIWSLRTLIEKPAKASVLSLIGQGSDEDIHDFLSEKAEEWKRRAGFLPIRIGEDGNPVIVSPATLNTWGDMQSLLDPDIERSVGPVVDVFVRAIDGEDEYGNPYPSDHVVGRTFYAMLDVVSGLPQFAGHRKEKPEKSKPETEITNRRSLIEKLNALADEAILSPGWAGGWGRLITGPAFTERTLDQDVLEAKMYRDLSAEDRHKVNKLFVKTQLDAQARLLDRKLPRNVREAATLFEDRAWAEHEWQQDHVRDWTDAELTAFHISYYTDLNLIPDEDLAAIRADAKKLATAGEHQGFRRKLFGAVTRDALAEWDEDVRMVAALTKPAVVNRRLDALASDGLLSDESRKIVKPDKAALTSYGRQVLAWNEENRERRDRLNEIDDPAQDDAEWSEYRAWLNETDRPVFLGNGVRLPSPARIQWAATKDDDRREIVYDRMTRPWELLSSLDKELVTGRKPADKIASGWQRFEEIKTEQLQGKRTPRGYDLQLARFINRDTDGFYRDWLFSREPLAVRLERMKPIQTSPHRATWNALFADAREGVKALKNPDFSKTDVREQWQTYVREQLATWATTQPGFAAELEMLGGPRILYELLS